MTGNPMTGTSDIITPLNGPSDLRVLLIKPHWKWGSRLEASPPLGLMYLSSSLKQRFPGISTRLLDLRLEKNRIISFKQVLTNWEPDIIGFTCLTGDNHVIEVLSETAKALLPSVHICCGGPYPTHVPEDFSRLAHVDSIVRGEGEQSFCDLISFLTGSTLYTNTGHHGYALRTTNGHLPIPDHSPAIQDPDRIPFPDWSLIDINTYSNIIQINAVLAGKRYMPVFTSRGCPFHCSYCHTTFGRQARLRSPENVVKEIEFLVKHHGVEEIQMYDDIFNIDRERVIRICRLIIERKLNIKIAFPNGVRSDMLDNEMIDLLKQAGAYMITFAIETASPRIQALIHKNLDIDKTVRAIRYAADSGLMTRGFFMVGFPSETENEIKQTIRLAKKLPLSTISVFKVIPFRGTPLYTLARHHTPHRGMELLMLPADTYFAAKTYFTESTRINLNTYIYACYFMFFTPVRLFRYFIKIPRKILYLKLLGGLLKTGFNSHINQDALSVKRK